MDPRVRRVIEPLLSGNNPKSVASEDDIAYVEDIGLITETTDGIKFSNKLYAEIIPRKITSFAHVNVEILNRADYIDSKTGLLFNGCFYSKMDTIPY